MTARPGDPGGNAFRWALAIGALAVAAAVTALWVGGVLGERSASRPAAPDDPGPIHVHGLGVNPRDGALFVATHTGLFRAPAGESKATRVGDLHQDTMGFTVVGPDRFLGSGHPDPRTGDPPFLGLIRSGDGGESWQPVSLRGDADFHVLEATGETVYGFGSDYDSRRAQFLVSADGGRTWDERDVPEPLISLAVNPDDPEQLVASGERGLHESNDGGRTWKPRAGPAGLIAWLGAGRLALVTGNGDVHVSADGTAWRRAGNAGGQPAAFEVAEDDLYVALHDGTIKRSPDEGRSWTVRSSPEAGRKS